MGEELQERVMKYKPMRLAAFYPLMARLEEAKYVKGRYVHSKVNGFAVRERFYSMTRQGHKAAEKKLKLISDFGQAFVLLVASSQSVAERDRMEFPKRFGAISRNARRHFSKEESLKKLQ